MSYPALYQWPSDSDHLLFDLGYSHALLSRVEGFLRTLEGDAQVDLLLADMASFRQGALTLRDQIYDAAPLAARQNALSDWYPWEGLKADPDAPSPYTHEFVEITRLQWHGEVEIVAPKELGQQFNIAGLLWRPLKKS